MFEEKKGCRHSWVLKKIFILFFELKMIFILFFKQMPSVVSNSYTSQSSVKIFSVIKNCKKKFSFSSINTFLIVYCFIQGEKKRDRKKICLKYQHRFEDDFLFTKCTEKVWKLFYWISHAEMEMRKFFKEWTFFGVSYWKF